MVIFCSLGFHCQCSQILKRNNLKDNSYPFDWIFCNIFIITDCINDNFEKLLDKKYYINYLNKTINDNCCGHSYYKKNLFPHRNMRTLNNYNYLVRCVNRFKDLYKNKEKKVFLITVIHSVLFSNIYNNLKNLNDILKNKKMNNFLLVCLIFLYNNKKNDHYIEINDNIHIIYIDCTSKTDGLKFEKESDNIYVDNIIKDNYL
jgi:hypothetical protein